MNKAKLLFLLVIATSFSADAFCQWSCSAAFLDEKIIVNEYTDNGWCEISRKATGDLTVQTANLSPENSIPTGKIGFKIAIRNGQTKTLLSFSGKTWKNISIEKILAKCKVGDSIVLIITDDDFALPHNEILVKE